MSTSKDELPTYQETTERLLNPAAQRKKRNYFMFGFLASSIIFLILIGVGVAAFVLFGLNNKTDQSMHCAEPSPVELMTSTVPTTVVTTTEDSMDRGMEDMGKSMEQAFKMMGMMMKGLQGLAAGEPRKPQIEYGDCDSSWVTANRTETGQKYCHRFFPQKLTYEEAEDGCREHGAHLSGFTGQSELDILDKMLDEAKIQGVRFDKDDNVWIGARRREMCYTKKRIEVEKGGFNPDQTHPCSRHQAFEWVNGVAQNPPDFNDRWVADIEPNLVSGIETCVELLKGVKNRKQWPKDVVGDKKLNDVRCNLKLYYLCGKEAPIVKTDE